MTDEENAKAGEPRCAHHADGGSPATPRQRRMSAKRKQEAVLRVLRGEVLELVSRDLGLTAADLSGWRDSFLGEAEPWRQWRRVSPPNGAASAHGTVGDVGAPHLVGTCDRQIFQKVWPDLVPGVLLRRVRRLIDRDKTHLAQ